MVYSMSMIKKYLDKFHPKRFNVQIRPFSDKSKFWCIEYSYTRSKKPNWKVLNYFMNSFDISTGRNDWCTVLGSKSEIKQKAESLKSIEDVEKHIRINKILAKDYKMRRKEYLKNRGAERII